MLQVVTRGRMGCKELQVVTRGYRVLQGVRSCYIGQQRVIEGYKGVEAL